MNKQQINTVEKLDTIVSQLYAEEKSGHDVHHIKRVVDLTRRILEGEDADYFVCLSIAYLHELFDDKLKNDTHTFDDLESLLRYFKIDLCGEERRIEKGIKSIGFKGGFAIPDRDREAQIVSDADKLDAMGAIGIGRAFYYAGSKGLPFHNPDKSYTQSTDSLTYRINENNVINHFDDKLLKLYDTLETDTGKKIGAVRHQRMIDFYLDFHSELDL